MNNWNKKRVVYLPIIIAFAIVSGIFIGRYYKNENTEKRFYIYPRTDKITNVINYISKEYVDPVAKESIVEKSIPKLLEELDPHSQYIPASDLQRVNEPLEGNFSGIGVQFNMLNDTLVVIQTIANGPSEKIGILAGDRIISVNDEPVAGVDMPSDSIVNKLRGPIGTKVEVGVLRREVDDILNFEITRDNIPLYSIDVAYIINDDIGYIKINQFSRTTFEEFVTSVNKLKTQNMQKMILDLRGNGGGYMNAAINITDQFLPDRELIVYTQGQARPREEFTSTPGGICKDIPVTVLIDEGSASASEILAGAIQDNDRGKIIGRRSFGKGLVQEQNVFSDGSAIRLTIARYYTPTGRSIQKPYTNGREDYYHDISRRYTRGEFEHEDSIHFADSLKYITPGGNIVYGGGGIMPDVFVPFDTTGFSDYLASVRNRGLIYRFSLQYADDHREQLERYVSYKELLTYLQQQELLQAFVKYAEKKGVPGNNKEISISREILETQLYAYISRNILDNEGFYPLLQNIDNTLQKAIALYSLEES